MPKTIHIHTTDKKPRLSFEQKKERKKRATELDRYGVVLGEIRSEREQNRFFLCFIRSLLIFMASFGMLGALVSSFELPFYLPIVIIGLFLLAFLSAFLYYNKLTFYVGYFIVFAGFIFFAVRFYWHINSGYQAFSNEVFNHYSDYFHLLSTRESTEVIEDRYQTVTAAMLFMGWFFSILLNISISGYMNLPMTFLLTFLPLQLPFYIDIVPPLPYLVLLISVYISVAILGRSGHFSLPYRHDRKQCFDRQRRKKHTRHTYLASSHGMLNITVYSVALSSLFLLLTGAIFSGDFNGKYVSNRVKDTTDRFMTAVVQNGLYSLFDRYHAKGGLARGQLGGIGNVNPDFQTDLIVRMVPYASENMYLKAFTGVTYDKNVFHPYAYTSEYGSPKQLTADVLSKKDADGYMVHLPADHNAGLNELSDSFDFYGKFWICNMDADQAYDYCPYYTFYSTSDRHTVSPALQQRAVALFEDSISMADSGETILSYAPENASERDVYELLYLPYSSALTYSPNPSVSPEYEEFVYDTYLQIPNNLRSSLSDFCEEAGLNSVRDYYPEYVFDPSVDESGATASFPATDAELELYYTRQQYRLGVAATLKRYFATEYYYTMTPGTTPRNRDVVDYFLNNQKRGYCAHFASSATMIMRSMGIPARYCEGYLLTLSSIMDGKPISTDTGNWITGTDKLSDSGIVEVELTDASAHAWIEIYLDGYGWIPYEMTPPSEEEPTVNLDLYNLFSGLMTQTNRNAAADYTGGNNTLQTADQINNGIFAILGGLRFLLRPLIILLGALTLFFLLQPSIKYLKNLLYIRKACESGKYAEALLYEYRLLLPLLRARKLYTLSHPTLRDFESVLRDRLMAIADLHEKDLPLLMHALQYSAFSKQGIDGAEYQKAAGMIRIIKKAVKHYRHSASGK